MGFWLIAGGGAVLLCAGLAGILLLCAHLDARWRRARQQREDQ